MKNSTMWTGVARPISAWALSRAILAVLLLSLAGPLLIAAQAQTDSTLATSPPLHRADLLDRSRVLNAVVLSQAGTLPVASRQDLQSAAPGAVVAVRLNEAPAPVTRMPDRSLRVPLPYRFMLPAPGATGGSELSLRAVAIIENGGLRYDSALAAYAGSVQVGIVDEKAPDAPAKTLGNAVPFLLTFSGGTVSPADPKIDHTNFPFSRAELKASAGTQSATLTIRASFDPTGQSVDIPIVKPPVDIQAPQTAPGFGLGSAQVSVTVPREFAADVQTITLEAPGAILDPNPVTVSAAGSGTTRLRSAGMGPVTITAADQDFESVPVTVNFVWPSVYTIFLLVGAVIGGFLWRLKKDSPKGAFWGGLALGVVVAVAAAAGINLTKWNLGEFATPAVGFVAGALPGASKWLGGSGSSDKKDN